MPIEIRELIIRTQITETDEENALQSGGDSNVVEDKEEIIAACVEQVMTILNMQKER